MPDTATEACRLMLKALTRPSIRYIFDNDEDLLQALEMMGRVVREAVPGPRLALGQMFLARGKQWRIVEVTQYFDSEDGVPLTLISYRATSLQGHRRWFGEAEIREVELIPTQTENLT